jgi:hypothetical protein
LIEAICALKKERNAAIAAGAVGLGFTLSWLLILRTAAVAHLPVWACWGMVAATIATTVPIQFALHRRLRMMGRGTQLFEIPAGVKLGRAVALR